ncbi:MAG: hypothetical protein KC423_10310 [Anaerolineales bacterium]|nr:hypothetical protein [Anaerolineales bacterium]
MDQPHIELAGITIAAVDVTQMVQFYNAVFAADLHPFAAFGTTLYRGQLAGLQLVFCPNDFLQIQAEKNRQQFSFAVSDIAWVVETAVSHGGTITQPINTANGTRYAGIADPDGNTIELRQPVSEETTR